jgi:bifunctional ADP-heptose synthase (sugar kinase/adenylyltransferase)
MTYIKCEIVEGFTPVEKIARIQGADGKIEEVAVPVQSIAANSLLAFVIGRDDKGKVLVELPRETASGRWRMWVNESAIGG